MALRGTVRAWHGERFADRMEAAAKEGIDELTAACLAAAQARAPVDTGFLRGSGFTRRARSSPGGVVGRWGFSAAYAAYVEFGTIRTSAQPYMRPAMDALYPTLHRRIRAAFRKRMR